MSARHQSMGFAASGEVPRRETLNLRRWSEQPPALPPRNDLGHHRSEADVLSASRVDSSEEHQPFSPSYQTSFSVTLIRRDPVSGGQWNVGRIATELPEPGHSRITSERLGKSRGTRVLLEILTCGYDKFKPENSKSQDPPSQHSTYLPFQRILSLDPFKPQSQDPSPRRTNFRSSIDVHQRSSKVQTPTSITSLPPPPPPILSSSRPYTFASPWNGSCEFATGIAGRSLKCRHTLDPMTDANVSSSSSPLTRSQWKQSSAPSSSTVVSELRFNLPSANVLAPKAAERPPLPPHYHLRHRGIRCCLAAGTALPLLTSPVMGMRMAAWTGTMMKSEWICRSGGRMRAVG